MASNDQHVFTENRSSPARGGGMTTSLTPPSPQTGCQPRQCDQLLRIEGHALGAQSGVLQRLAGTQDGLLAVWATEYGPLNRVLTLHDAPMRNAVQHVESQEPDDWLHPRDVSRHLEVRRPLRHHLLAKPLHELRMYATRAGRHDAFLAALLSALAFRERYSPCAAVWTTRERGFDLVVHLWAYDSIEHRTAARSAAHRDTHWSDYRASIRPLLHNLQAWLLTRLPLPDAELRP